MRGARRARPRGSTVEAVPRPRAPVPSPLTWLYHRGVGRTKTKTTTKTTTTTKTSHRTGPQNRRESACDLAASPSLPNPATDPLARVS